MRLAAYTVISIFTALVCEKAHRAKAAEREHRDWLEVTLTSIGDAVIATDSEGRITFMNAPAEAMTGWRQFEAVGRRLSSVFVVVTQNAAEESGEDTNAALGEGRFLRARYNRLMPVDDTITLVRDETGQLTAPTVLRQFEDFLNAKHSRSIGDHAADHGGGAVLASNVVGNDRIFDRPS